jgi:hypothetical protein
LLWSCDAALDESARAAHKTVMPGYCITCISHMLCDECVVACLIPLSTLIMTDEWRTIFPLSARFKAGLDIKEHVTKVINKVEAILKIHCQSGHHASGD